MQWRSQGGHGPPRNICDIVFIVVFLMTHAKFIKQGQVWPPRGNFLATPLLVVIVGLLVVDAAPAALE